MLFRIGFKYKKFRFGWHKNELWRLPDEVGGRSYSFKKLPQITLPGETKGYRLEGDKISISQIATMNREVEWEVKMITGPDFTLLGK